MLRYLSLGLLLGSLAVAANPEITHTRWQGRWGDGVITSYSIHYTKLYDCITELGSAHSADRLQSAAR